MEENKKVPMQGAGQNGQNAQNAQSQNGQGGGRHRRRKKKHGNGGGQNTQNTQNMQNTKNPQNAQSQNGQGGQNQGARQTQNGESGQNGQNVQRGKGEQSQKLHSSNGQNPQNGQKQHNQNNQNNQNNQKQKQKNKGQNAQNNASAQNENRKDTYVYTLDGNLYINLTNKCSNGCDFCVRNERTSYYGNYLWLKNGDPTPEKVISAANGFGDITRFKEVVFCGFGEPTYRVSEMVTLCDYFHSKGLKTRLNTNGQGNLINKRDIVPELKDKLDLVNVSLNASCAEKYQPICRSQFGESGFTALVDFAKSCRKAGIPCRFSIVDCIGEEEVEACKRLAESVKVPLYVRKYITDS